MKKILLVLSLFLFFSSLYIHADEKGKWVTVKLEGTGQQIVEFEADDEMYYALYFTNECENDVIIEHIAENGEIISKTEFAPGVSGGTIPSEKAKKCSKGKYTFLIKTEKDSELEGEFSYMFSENIEDFKKESIPTDYRVTARTELAQLNDMGIMKECEGGPYDNVSRAEMANIVTELIKITYDTQESGFSDVPYDHKYSGNIYVVKNMGIMCGYGNGIFRPDNDITYSEAVKTLVTLLGYEPKAERDGYPVGYLKTANEIGLIISPVATDSAITKNDIAKLVLRATEIPLMVQQSFGNDAEYTITDETLKTKYLGK